MRIDRGNDAKRKLHKQYVNKPSNDVMRNIFFNQNVNKSWQPIEEKNLAKFQQYFFMLMCLMWIDNDILFVDVPLDSSNDFQMFDLKLY